MPQTKEATCLTAQDVREIVGRITHDRLLAILATGATPAQVVEAFTWLSDDEHPGAELERSLTGPVAQVYEILKADDQAIEEQWRRG
jgi:hypothetical protein